MLRTNGCGEIQSLQPETKISTYQSHNDAQSYSATKDFGEKNTLIGEKHDWPTHTSGRP
jgi:hypothetical protein